MNRKIGNLKNNSNVSIVTRASTRGEYIHTHCCSYHQRPRRLEAKLFIFSYMECKKERLRTVKCKESVDANKTKRHHVHASLSILSSVKIVNKQDAFFMEYAYRTNNLPWLPAPKTLEYPH